MIEILSIINWESDVWHVVYRYQGTLRSTKYHNDYMPSNYEVKKFLKEIHNVP